MHLSSAKRSGPILAPDQRARFRRDRQYRTDLSPDWRTSSRSTLAGDYLHITITKDQAGRPQARLVSSLKATADGTSLWWCRSDRSNLEAVFMAITASLGPTPRRAFYKHGLNNRCGKPEETSSCVLQARSLAPRGRPSWLGYATGAAYAGRPLAGTAGAGVINF